MSVRVKAIGFFHSYARDGELGSYMKELVSAFEALGVEFHLVLANSLVGTLQNKGYRWSISADKLLDYIDELSPDFIFTTNRAGITNRIVERASCPIITWMVDRIPFYHHGGGDSDLFTEKDIVIASSRSAVRYYEQRYPVLRGRVALLSFATNPSDFSSSFEKDVNVVFVGSYFHSQSLKDVLAAASSDKSAYQALLSLIAEVREDYQIDIDRRVAHYDLGSLLAGLGLSPIKLKGLISNTVSLNNRIKYLDAVSDKGLMLYGTQNWVNVNQYSLDLLHCFQSHKFIKTRAQLVELYQRSKIALNISHHQAEGGLPYRVFDIMASDALLISQHQKQSDLNHFFGVDCPVPTYKDEKELRKLVDHFLSHDLERAQIVSECNRLISEGFTFQDRVKDICLLAGIKLEGGGDEVPVQYVDVESKFVKTPELFWLGVSVILRFLRPVVAQLARFAKKSDRSRLLLKRILPEGVKRVLISCLK